MDLLREITELQESLAEKRALISGQWEAVNHLRNLEESARRRATVLVGKLEEARQEADRLAGNAAAFEAALSESQEELRVMLERASLLQAEAATVLPSPRWGER